LSGSGTQSSSRRIDLDAAYRKFRPIVVARVKSQIGDGTPEWEDVVSRIFLSLVEYVRSGKFRGEGSVGTVLFTITRRRLADYMRKKYKDEGKDEEGVSVIYDTVQSDLESRQFVTSVVTAMDCLTPRQREVFTLCTMGDMRVREVAEALAISESRVEAAYARAREKMSDKMARWEPEVVEREALVDWVEKMWGAYVRLGTKKKILDGVTQKFAEAAKNEIVRRLLEE